MPITRSQPNFTAAIEATVQFYRECIEVGRQPSELFLRIQARRAAEGRPTREYKGVSTEDEEKFVQALRDTLIQRAQHQHSISLEVDYEPWFLLRDIIDKAGVEDPGDFIYRASFPWKSTVTVFHDHVALHLNGDKMPLIWASRAYLAADTPAPGL